MDNATSSRVFKRQRLKFGPKVFHQDGTKYRITANVRFDDDCGNGHNTFSVTGDIDRWQRGRWVDDAGGCIHDEIRAHFPELAPLIKWHLCSSDGPLHYIANTTHFAGDRDFWGRRAGEPSAWARGVRFGSNPIIHRFGRAFMDYLEACSPPYDMEVLRCDHRDRGKPGAYQYSPKWMLGAVWEWHCAPFGTEQEALDFLGALQTCSPEFVKVPTAYSEGKARELDAARSAAIWPDATDEELTAPGLAERLEARLPALLADFRAAIESIGLKWEPEA